MEMTSADAVWLWNCHCHIRQDLAIGGWLKSHTDLPFDGGDVYPTDKNLPVIANFLHEWADAICPKGGAINGKR